MQARIDIANPRLGDAGTQAVITNADGSQYIYAVRLKVKDSRITEVEAMLIRNVEEGGLFDLKTLQRPNPNFTTPIRPAEQDSCYDLVAEKSSTRMAETPRGGSSCALAPSAPPRRRPARVSRIAPFG